jgi:purine-binding chemotaxis protein CheW
MTGDLQLCVMRVGQEDYAVDIRRVDEILAVPKLTSVPRGPAFLEGVVTLRGEVLPVVDVRRRLGVAPSAGDAKSKKRERLLVCRIGRRRVGFIVDAVTQVIRQKRSDLRPAPLTQVPGRVPHVLGVCGEQGKLKLLLDVKALVQEEGK